MNEKKKKHSNRVGTIPFILLWTLSYGLGWAGLIGSVLVLDNLFSAFFNSSPNLVLLMLLGAIPGLISGAIQQPLMRWKFGIQIRRWWLWSMLGSALATGGFYVYVEYLETWFRPLMNYLAQFNELLQPAIIFGIMFVIYSAFQAWVLRNHVKRVWMWSLAAFISAATFLLPFIDSNGSSELWMTITGGIAGLLQGSVMALTLVWLFGMTRSESAAQDYDTSRLQAKNKHEDENESIMEIENQVDENQSHER